MSLMRKHCAYDISIDSGSFVITSVTLSVSIVSRVYDKMFGILHRQIITSYREDIRKMLKNPTNISGITISL